MIPMDKKEKTFAQNFSTEFEKLMLEISNDIFEANFKVIASGNTKEKSDGGRARVPRRACTP